MKFEKRGTPVQQFSIQQAERNLPVLIDAALSGEEVVIPKDDHPAVRLVPADCRRAAPRFGSAKGLLRMSEDFDEPLEDFAEYLE